MKHVKQIASRLALGVALLIPAAFLAGAAHSARSPLPASAETETLSPAVPLGECTPVPYEQYLDGVQDAQAEVGATFDVYVLSSLGGGCDCECQTDWINPAPLGSFHDQQALEAVDIPSALKFPVTTLRFRALRAGVTSVQVSSSFGAHASNTITITDPHRATADFDASGCTNIDDFLILVDNWQAVPPRGGEVLALGDFLALLDNWQSGPSC